MSILLIAEHDHHQLKPANYHVLSAANELGHDIDIFIIGFNCETVVKQAQALPVREVLVADAKEYAHLLPENTAALIADIAKEYEYILMPADTFGKNILPRVAALLDVAMISDVIKIIAKDTFARPIYAGNAIATVQTTDAIKLLTIRQTAFSPCSTTTHQAPIKTITHIIKNDHSQFKNSELTVSNRPELTAAKIVISGGRGLKSAENFQLLEKIADCLGAAVGASRAAVDAGFVPNDYQVGQTGKVVAPELYIAVGISGAIQHIAGMKDSKVIVAINNDPDAPIFQIADYGLVGDLFTILPELYAKIARK